MKKILTNFVLGPHVGLTVSVEGGETEFLNELINTIIDLSTIEVDKEALNEEAIRVEKELREGLRNDMKSVGAFCYANGITEDCLGDYCKVNLVRTAAENTVIDAIAKTEGIKVTPDDISDYKREYRDQYAKILLTEPDFGEDELHEAILVRKVLNFLKDNNTHIVLETPEKSVPEFDKSFERLFSRVDS